MIERVTRVQDYLECPYMFKNSPDKINERQLSGSYKHMLLSCVLGGKADQLNDDQYNQALAILQKTPDFKPLPGVPIICEKQLLYRFGDGNQLRGTPDIAQIDLEKKVGYIGDYKTGRRLYDTKECEDSLQFKLYPLMLWEDTGRVLERVYFEFIFTEYNVVRQLVWQPSKAAATDQFLHGIAEQMHHSMRHDDWPATPGAGHCRFCRLYGCPKIDTNAMTMAPLKRVKIDSVTDEINDKKFEEQYRIMVAMKSRAAFLEEELTAYAQTRLDDGVTSIAGVDMVVKDSSRSTVSKSKEALDYFASLGIPSKVNATAAIIGKLPPHILKSVIDRGYFKTSISQKIVLTDRTAEETVTEEVTDGEEN